MSKKGFVIFLVILAIILIACFGFWNYSKHSKDIPSSTSSLQPAATSSQSSNQAFDPMLANEAILALKNKDAVKLASLTDPVQGVRFSSSAYVSKNDVVFTREGMRNFFKDKKIYTWGVTDGKGDDIRLTPAEYYKQYIYNADYVNVPQVSYNKVIGKGNTINNASEFYPNETIVEYYFPGLDPKFSGMDWTSLRLVFQKEDNDWYLVGIIKDNWTI